MPQQDKGKESKRFYKSPGLMSADIKQHLLDNVL